MPTKTGQANKRDRQTTCTNTACHSLVLSGPGLKKESLLLASKDSGRVHASGTDGLHPPALQLKGRYFRGDRSAGFEFLLIAKRGDGLSHTFRHGGGGARDDTILKEVRVMGLSGDFAETQLAHETKLLKTVSPQEAQKCWGPLQEQTRKTKTSCD